MHAEIGEEIFLAQRAQSCSPGHGHYPRRCHDRSLGQGMRVQEQPPVQFDPQPGRLVDEAEILAEWHQQPQLRIIDVGRGIEAAIAGARDERRRCRQRLVW